MIKEAGNLSNITLICMYALFYPFSMAQSSQVLALPLAKIAFSERIDSFDPVEIRTIPETEQVRRIYRTLYHSVEARNTPIIVPDIASGFPILSKDRKTIRIPIRGGFIFHGEFSQGFKKNRRLEVEDILASFNRVLAHPKTSWIFADKVTKLEPFSVNANRELEIHLVRPYAPLEVLLSLPQLSILPVEVIQHSKETGKFMAVGTGDYVVREYTSNGAVLEPIMAGPKGKFKLELRFGDSNKILSWLRSKDIDGIDMRLYDKDVRHEAVKRENGSFVVLHRKTRDLTFTALNHRNGIFSDQRVRQAMSLVVDTRLAIPIFYDGYAQVANTIIPKGILGFSPGGGHFRRQNINEAKRLMAEAGYPEGKKFPILNYDSTSNPWSIKQADFLKEKLAQIGIRINIQRIDEEERWPRFVSGKSDLFGTSIPAEMHDPDYYLQFFYSKSPANFMGLKDPWLDEQISFSREEANSKKRKALIDRIVRYIDENCFVILGVTRDKVMYVRPTKKDIF